MTRHHAGLALASIPRHGNFRDRAPAHLPFTVTDSSFPPAISLWLERWLKTVTRRRHFGCGSRSLQKRTRPIRVADDEVALGRIEIAGRLDGIDLLQSVNLRMPVIDGLGDGTKTAAADLANTASAPFDLHRTDRRRRLLGDDPYCVEPQHRWHTLRRPPERRGIARLTTYASLRCRSRRRTKACFECFSGRPVHPRRIFDKLQLAPARPSAVATRTTSFVCRDE